MPLEGSVFLALWNDFDPARDAEYESWHTFEHVPERIGVPGMIRGRRYRATERAENRYFTLYEVEEAAVLASPAYLDLVKRPTEWSRAMRPSFRNVARVPCETVTSVGVGIGGYIATVVIKCARRLDEKEFSAIRAACEGEARGLSATAMHLGRSIAALSDYPIFKGGQVAGPEVRTVETLVILAEATVRRDALAAAERVRSELLGRALEVEIDHALGFDLVYSVERADLQLTSGTRAAPRDDVRLLATAS